MHMGSDATKYQCKTFMDINTPQRKLENRESHRNQCTFEHLRDLDPLPRAYHVFEWPSNGKKVHVNKQRCYISMQFFHVTSRRFVTIRLKRYPFGSLDAR